jgi:hypothetical protein
VLATLQSVASSNSIFVVSLILFPSDPRIHASERAVIPPSLADDEDAPRLQNMPGRVLLTEHDRAFLREPICVRSFAARITFAANGSLSAVRRAIPNIPLRRLPACGCDRAPRLCPGLRLCLSTFSPSWVTVDPRSKVSVSPRQEVPLTAQGMIATLRWSNPGEYSELFCQIVEPTFQRRTETPAHNCHAGGRGFESRPPFTLKSSTRALASCGVQLAVHV